MQTKEPGRGPETGKRQKSGYERDARGILDPRIAIALAGLLESLIFILGLRQTQEKNFPRNCTPTPEGKIGRRKQKHTQRNWPTRKIAFLDPTTKNKKEKITANLANWWVATKFLELCPYCPGWSKSFFLWPFFSHRLSSRPM